MRDSATAAVAPLYDELVCYGCVHGWRLGALGTIADRLRHGVRRGILDYVLCVHGGAIDGDADR